jgi:hypothetical protein
MGILTKVRLHDQSRLCETEKEAYVWLLDQYISEKGDFFYEQPETIRAYLSGRRGAVLFGPLRDRLNQPERLRNGWFAETCLNEQQKVRNLYLLAQALNISWERDVEWQAQGRPAIEHKDVDTLLAELARL